MGQTEPQRLILSQEQALKSMEYYFNTELPIDINTSPNIYSNKVTEKWMNGIIRLGDDYANLLIDMAKQKDGNDLQFLKNCILRNSKRRGNWVKKQSINSKNLQDENLVEGSEFTDFTCQSVEFSVCTSGELESRINLCQLTKHVHVDLMKLFCNCFENHQIASDEPITIPLVVDESRLSGFEYLPDSNYKKKYLSHLMDFLLVLVYCPYLFIEYFTFGKLERNLELDGNIFDKDFYLKDVKYLAEVLGWKSEHVQRYISLELVRFGVQGMDDLLQNWEDVMISQLSQKCEEHDSVIQFCDRDGTSGKSVSVIKDIAFYRCSFLRLMIASGMKESTQKIVELECSYDVVLAFFEFICTGSVISESCAIELIMYCDAIGFTLLQNISAHIVKNNITNEEQALTILNLAKSLSDIRHFQVIQVYCESYIQYYKKYVNAEPSSNPQEEICHDNFTLYSAMKPITEYNDGVYGACFGLEEKSGRYRLLHQLAFSKFDNSTLLDKNIFYTKQLGRHQFQISMPENQSQTQMVHFKKILICISVLNDYNKVKTKLEDIMRFVPYIRQHSVICLTMCDIPYSLWKVNRKDLLNFADKMGVSYVETSALLSLNLNILEDTFKFPINFYGGGL